MPIPGHAAPLDPSHCTLCRLWHTDPRYRALWSGAAVPPGQPRGPCRYEGEVVSWCPKCPSPNGAGHARHCLHDDGPDTCRRSVECKSCSLHEEAQPPAPGHLAAAPPPG